MYYTQTFVTITMALGGLQLELETYLHKLLMKHAKVTKFKVQGQIFVLSGMTLFSIGLYMYSLHT